MLGGCGLGGLGGTKKLPWGAPVPPFGATLPWCRFGLLALRARIEEPPTVADEAAELCCWCWWTRVCCGCLNDALKLVFRPYEDDNEEEGLGGAPVSPSAYRGGSGGGASESGMLGDVDDVVSTMRPSAPSSMSKKRRALLFLLVTHTVSTPRREIVARPCRSREPCWA